MILLGRVCKTEPILEAITTARLVYLEATEVTRRQRYAHGQVLDVVKRSTTFDDAMRHATESEASSLRSMASLVVETDGLTVAAVVQVVRHELDW